MGWEDVIAVDDTAIIDRWQWRMNTPKSEADSTAPSFKEVWQAINPLQNIPIIGSIYRALTGDEPTPTARAVGGLIYGGPIGLLIAGISNLASEAAGGDPIEKSVARLAGKDAPLPEVASAKPAATEAAPPQDTPPQNAAIQNAAVQDVAVPTAPAPKPAAREREREVAAIAAPAAPPVDPYAKFQPKRTTVQHTSRIAQNLAALNMAAMTGPAATATTTASAPAAATPPVAASPAPTPLVPKSVAPKADVTETPAATMAERTRTPPPSATPVALTEARDFATAGGDAGGRTPAWFSQAVLGALDRYREAGGLRPPAPTNRSVDTKR